MAKRGFQYPILRDRLAASRLTVRLTGAKPMPTRIDKIKEAVRALHVEGVEILMLEAGRNGVLAPEQIPDFEKLKKKNDVPFSMAYQAFYTRALPLVRQVLPDRYEEFVRQYQDPKRKDITWTTYTISDYCLGTVVTRYGENIFSTIQSCIGKFQIQLFIFESISARLDSLLADVSAVLQGEMFDDELAAAHELAKKGHLRAAGALAGVTTERHLGVVCRNHAVVIAKKSPTIGEFNDALKAAGIYDAVDWRFIQRLGDIRNLCAHSKERDPTKDEVVELLAGVSKILKTIA